MGARGDGAVVDATDDTAGRDASEDHAGAMPDAAGADVSRAEVAALDVDATDAAPRTPRGDTCDDAIPLPMGGEVIIEPPSGRASGTTTETCTNLVMGALPARWVRVTVPPRTRVDLVGDRTPDPYPYHLRGLTACAVEGCVTRSELQFDDRIQRLSWGNPADTPMTFFVAVTASTPPSFRVPLRAVATPIAPNGACAAATPVADATALSNVELGRAGEPVRACAASSTYRRDHLGLFYRVAVPRGHTVFATVRPDGGRPLSFFNGVSLRRACGDDVCLAEGADGVGGLGSHSLAWTSDGSSPEVVIALTDKGFAPSSAANVRFRVVPGATNTSCAAAAPLVPGEPQEANVATAIEALLTGLPAPVRTLFYRITVPGASTLTVTVHAIEGLNDVVGVQVYDGCGDAQYLSRPGADVPVEATFHNEGAARSVVVAVVAPGREGGRVLARVTAQIRPR